MLRPIVRSSVRPLVRFLLNDSTVSTPATTTNQEILTRSGATILTRAGATIIARA